MKTIRLGRLPESLSRTLKEARIARGWSQRELASRLGLTQSHISSIEAGTTVPRYDTLLDLVRILDRDLVLVPRALVPAVQGLIHNYLDDKEEALYAVHDADNSGDEA